MDLAHRKAEKLFQKTMEEEGVHNAFLAVYSPNKQIDWTFVSGHFQDGDDVTINNPFYTASIGKVFTATAIAILQEDGMLGFDDPIAKYLPDSIVSELHVLNGIDYSDQIRISHLLQHASGLPDFFESPTTDGSPNVMELLFIDPDKTWNPIETIQFSKEKMRPVFAPGEGFLYTDTEYNLLGLIIEQISGKRLHDFFRDRIFEPLEMKHTSMNLLSKPIQKTERMSELYAGNLEISKFRSLSADWAGGGLRSTTSDLIKFQMALNSGRIIATKSLEMMQNWIPETKGMEYGFGLRKISFRTLFPLLPKLTIIGHSGSTASFMYYCPELDVYLAGTLNQTEEVKQSIMLLVRLLSTIKKHTTE